MPLLASPAASVTMAFLTVLNLACKRTEPFDPMIPDPRNAKLASMLMLMGLLK